MDAQKSYCGIDVSVDVLDVCHIDNARKCSHFQATNNRTGYKRILKTYPLFLPLRNGIHGRLPFGTDVFFLDSDRWGYSVVNGLQMHRHIQMHLE